MSKDKLKPMLFSTLKHYDGKQFGKDVVSGVIVAIIALPLSIALALASGVGPEEGLYTAIVAGFIISFLGGSRVQIAGPTAMHSLEQFYERCRERNITLVFSHVNEQPMNTMKKDGFFEKVGEENFRPHIDDAIAWATELIKK